MRKIIKRWGDSNIIVLSPEECIAYGQKDDPLVRGDVVDVEIFKIVESEVTEGFI